MFRCALVSLLALLVASCGGPDTRPPALHLPTWPAAETPEQIAETRLVADIAVLSEHSDRALGSPGLVAARDYITAQLEAAGAQPGFVNRGCAPNGSDVCAPDWLHHFDVDVVAGSPAGRFGIEPPGVGPDWIRPQLRWWADPNTPPANLADAPVSFAGYGVRAGDYDDYAGVDVTGHVVIVLAGLPERADLGAADTRQAFATTGFKTMVARSAGAAAVVIVHETYTPPPASLEPALALPAVHLLRSTTTESFDDISLDEAEAFLQATGRPQSRNLSATSDLTIIQEVQPTQTWNVVGALGPTQSGRAPILVTAHYDHLQPGSTGTMDSSPQAETGPFPGADDNASGVAVMLELARVLATMESDLRRPVYFVALSGEETGLWGSHALIEAFGWRPHQTLAVVNLDMVGRLDGGALLVDGRESAAAFSDVLDGALMGLDLVVADAPVIPGMSDHDSYLAVGVPAIHLTTGLHGDWHTTADTPSQIDGPGVALTARFAFGILHRLAVSDDLTIAWNAKVYGEAAALGIVPHHAPNTSGVLVTDVRFRGPAERAGLRKDDVVIAVNGEEVGDMRSLLMLIGKHRPGDDVLITVSRGAKPVTLPIVMGSR